VEIHNLGGAEPPFPPAVVLSGGLGTRLHPVYNEGPKVLAPVAGYPFLAYVLAWLRRQGIASVILCVGYKHSQIQELFPEECGFMKICYSVEAEPLGTAGALKHAESSIYGDCMFVMNGDSLLDVSLSHLLSFHRARGALATLAVAEVASATRYGTVVMDEECRICAFREKSEYPEAGRQQVNGGVYVLDREVLQWIPPHRAVSLEREIFPALIGKRLYGYATRGFFIDIGVPEDFQRAQSELPKAFNYDHSC
jgi:NDP-sugar pyrophosphorylase family protein